MVGLVCFSRKNLECKWLWYSLCCSENHFTSSQFILQGQQGNGWWDVAIPITRSYRSISSLQKPLHSFYKDRGWARDLQHLPTTSSPEVGKQSPRCRTRSRSYKGFTSFYLKGSSVTQLPPGKVHSHQHTTQELRNEGWEGPRDDKTRALGADRQVAPSGSTWVFRLWLFCLLRPSIYWLYWSLCYSLVLPLYQRPEIDSRKDLKRHCTKTITSLSPSIEGIKFDLGLFWNFFFLSFLFSFLFFLETGSLYYPRYSLIPNPLASN